jgi:hypothetical protein
MRCPEIAQVLLTSRPSPLVTMTSRRRRSPLSTVPTTSMTLFMASVPLMVLAVALAVLPLILMSRAEHRGRIAEATSRSGIPVSGHSSDSEIS